MSVGGTAERARMRSLDSMRAIAALIVFGFHMNIPALVHVTGQGRVGVSFFFVLSGMLLALTWKKSDSVGRFYRRRAARIYPVYLVALALGAIATFTIAPGPGTPLGGALSVVLLQSWIPDSNIYYTWNAVGWSLGTEAFFYLLFPFLAPLVVQLQGRALNTLRALALSAIIGLGIYASVALPHGYSQANNFASWATYISPLSRLPEFVLGMTLAVAVRGPRLRISKPIATALLVIAYLASGFDPAGLGLTALTIVPLCFFLVRFAQGDIAGEKSILHSRTLVSLGAASYCFYLIHHIVWRVASVLLGDSPLPGVSLAFAIVVSIGGAYLLHYKVEVPLDQKFKGRSRATVTIGR